jgi:phosphohistidine phosphatase
VKRLILVRHAKSSWKDASLADFDRPLNKRGKQDVQVMGNRLAQRGIAPDCIVSSPARRARRTARAVAETLDYPEEDILFEDVIYEAGVPDLLQVVRCLDDSDDEVILVGHNPGFTDLCNRLSGETIANLPTCAAACIAFDLSSWSQVGPETGELAFFDYPKRGTS